MWNRFFPLLLTTTIGWGVGYPRTWSLFNEFWLKKLLACAVVSIVLHRREKAHLEQLRATIPPPHPTPWGYLKWELTHLRRENACQVHACAAQVSGVRHGFILWNPRLIMPRWATCFVLLESWTCCCPVLGSRHWTCQHLTLPAGLASLHAPLYNQHFLLLKGQC